MSSTESADAPCDLTGTAERHQQCARAARGIIQHVTTFDHERREAASIMGNEAADALYRKDLNLLHTRLLSMCPSCPMQAVKNYIEAEIL